jgi:solute carrier family 35 protein C2
MHFISVKKVIFGQNLGAFPCPLLLTSVHFFVQWMFSYTVSSIFPYFFGGTAVENMSWSTFLGEYCEMVTLLDYWECHIISQPLQT